MSNLIVFSGVVLLFFVWLLVKALLKNKKLCAICAATTTTWIVLLVLRFLGLYENDLVLALLMGASATGGYYFLSRYPKMAIFKLPIFLSLVIGAYLVAVWQIDWPLVLLVLVVWVVFGLISLGKSNGAFIKKIIECCKNW